MQDKCTVLEGEKAELQAKVLDLEGTVATMQTEWTEAAAAVLSAYRASTRAGVDATAALKPHSDSAGALEFGPAIADLYSTASAAWREAVELMNVAAEDEEDD